MTMFMIIISMIRCNSLKGNIRRSTTLQGSKIHFPDIRISLLFHTCNFESYISKIFSPSQLTSTIRNLDQNLLRLQFLMWSVLSRFSVFLSRKKRISTANLLVITTVTKSGINTGFLSFWQKWIEI